MYKQVKRIQLFLISSIILTIFAPPAADAAPQAATDARWRPWLGCWATNDNSPACIVPSASPTAVELVILSAGKEVYRETIDASGEQKDRTFEGCDGWESGRWSDDGRRLYLNSEYRCGNGSVRTGKELFSISPAGEWVDSISFKVNENTGVRTTRRRVVPPPDAILREFAGMNTLRPLSRTDTINPPIGFAEIVEASRLLDGPVVEAWLSVVQPRMKVDSRRLMNLTRAGVPEGVLDLLVALAYPKRFSIEPAAPDPFAPPFAAPVDSSPVVTEQVAIVETIFSDPVYVRHPSQYCGFDSHHWDRCGGWRPAPDVIVINGGRAVAPPQAHGRVTQEGYQSGNNQTKESPASTSTESASTDSRTDSKAEAKSDSRETTASSPPPAAAPEQRTAHPR